MSEVVALGSPAAMEAMASLVDRDHDFRVLRRMPPMRRNVVRGVRRGMLAGCAVHVETTGGRRADDAVIELALQRFWADEEGRIVMTGRPQHWLEDPRRPIPPETTRRTGLADPDVAGRTIMDPVAASLILDADFIVAYDASFDRPFVEKRLPLVAGRPWVSAKCDVEWQGNGFTVGGLPHLLTQMGLFYDPHRASTEVTALLHLLDHPLPFGGTVLKAAVEDAAKPAWVIDAVGAPRDGRPVERSGISVEPLRAPLVEGGLRHGVRRRIRMDRGEGLRRHGKAQVPVRDLVRAPCGALLTGRRRRRPSDRSHRRTTRGGH